MPEAVLLIVGVATGMPTEFDNQYVVEYDASRGDGRYPIACHLVTTPDLEKATRFEFQDALELYCSVDQRRPTRYDGEPNRPLTAFTVEVVRV